MIVIISWTQHWLIFAQWKKTWAVWYLSKVLRYTVQGSPTCWEQHHIRIHWTAALWKGISFLQKTHLIRKVKKKVWHGWGVSLFQLIAHSQPHLSLCEKARGWWLIGQVRWLGKYALSDSQWPLKQRDGGVGLKFSTGSEWKIHGFETL